MLKFNDFISTIRTDRFREIKNKEANKLVVADASTYRYINSIKLKNDAKEYSFGVQSSYGEIYFYINEDGSNCYYTIEDLYNLLRLMCVNREDKKYVLSILDMLMMNQADDYDDADKIEAENYFEYQGIPYYFYNPLIKEDEKKISLKEGDPIISYAKILVLINLIQQKSNTFFNNGNVNYVNGLIRMFKVLIIVKKNHPILKQKGWNYNYKQKKFSFTDVKNEKEKSYKYYLTDEEYKTIMGV